MTFKNTFKLILSNFSNTWKLLLYRIICVLCVLGLTTVVAWPIINVLIKENFFVNLQTYFESLLFNLNLENLFLCVDNTIKNLYQIVLANGYLTQTILSGIFVAIIFAFLDGYARVAISESCNGFMSSLTKYAFTNSFVSNFGRATLLNLASLITTWPLTVIIWVGTYLFASNLYASMKVFAIILAMLLLVVSLSLKQTFFGGWKPALIVHNKSVFVSLSKGAKAIFKRFFRSLSNYLVLVIIGLIINAFALTFTAGVALFITIPLTSLMFIVADQVMYYEAMGMRFYVDADHIISPKKLEQQDKLAKVKYII